MNWDNFYFQCRYLAQKVSPQCDVEQAKRSLVSDYPPSSLTQPLVHQSIADDLMIKLTRHSDIETQRKLLALYSKLPLAWSRSSVNKLWAVLSYLTLLVVLFVVMSTIYKTFVYPNFVSIFTLSERAIDPMIENYTNFWVVALLAILIPYILLLLIYTQLKKLEISPHVPLGKITTKLILSAKIDDVLQRLTALSYAPLQVSINQYSAQYTQLIKQYDVDNLEVSQELSILLKDYQEQLTKLLNKRIRILTTLLSFFIIVGIFNFIYSLYLPIFSIGEII